MGAYCLIVGMPNLDADYGPGLPVDLARQAAGPQWPTAWPEPEQIHLEGDEVLATTIQPVSYRDRLGSRYQVYTSRQKLARDVVVAFLVDKSSSTAEHVEPPHGAQAARTGVAHQTTGADFGRTPVRS